MAATQDDESPHASKNMWLFSCATSAEVTEQKLASSIASPSFLGLGKDGVRGTVSDADVRLYYIPRGTRNSFTPYFYGRICPAESGSTLVGEFRLHTFVRIGMSVAVGFAACFLVVAIAINAVQAATEGFQRENLLFIVIPLAIVFGWMLVAFLGRYAFGAANERRVVRFIVDALDAQIENAPAEPRWPGKSQLTSIYLRL